jgi:hypothetical protein
VKTRFGGPVPVYNMVGWILFTLDYYRMEAHFIDR